MTKQEYYLVQRAIELSIRPHQVWTDFCDRFEYYLIKFGLADEETITDLSSTDYNHYFELADAHWARLGRAV